MACGYPVVPAPFVENSSFPFEFYWYKYIKKNTNTGLHHTFWFIFSLSICQLPERENNNEDQSEGHLIWLCFVPQSRLHFKIKRIYLKELGQSKRGALVHFEKQRFWAVPLCSHSGKCDGCGGDQGGTGRATHTHSFHPIWRYTIFLKSFLII